MLIVVVVAMMLMMAPCVSAVAMGGAIMNGEYPACDGSQNAILECFKFIFDLNHDDVVTYAEVDERFAMNITGVPGPFQDTQRIKDCDVDKDGNLTMADWDSPNRTCLIHPGATTIACEVCKINGFVMTPPDYFVPPSKRSVGRGEPQRVRFTPKQLHDHAAKDHVHANEYKKAAAERLERHYMMTQRFHELKKWKQKQIQEESLKRHVQLTEKHMTDMKKRLVG